MLLLVTSHISRPLMKQIVTELAAHVAANRRKAPSEEESQVDSSADTSSDRRLPSQAAQGITSMLLCTNFECNE